MCPACGANLKSFQVVCICGHEITNANSNKTIKALLDEIKNLKKINDDDLDFEESVAHKINNTPIPITKEDLLEFMSVCCSQADVDFMARGSGKIPSAWSNKGNEALLKAKIAFRDDTNTMSLLNDFEKKLKSSTKKSKLIWVFMLFVFALLGGMIALIEFFDK